MKKPGLQWFIMSFVVAWSSRTSIASTHLEMRLFTSVLGSGTSRFYGVSADGRVAVGENQEFSPSLTRALRWSDSTGMQNLGMISPPSDPQAARSSALATNRDGSIVVGESSQGAFRWTSGVGMQSMGTFSAGSSSNRVFPKAINSSGDVVAGFGLSTDSSGDGTRAFRWTVTGGYQDLGIPAGATQSFANGVSGDGLVITGFFGTQSAKRPFRWTESTGMQDLGLLPGGTTSSARAISADGRAISGEGTTPSGRRAFLWTEVQGMRVLPSLPNTIESFGGPLSADGSVMVGWSRILGRGERLTLWQSNGAVIDVLDFLQSRGVSTGGSWSIIEPTGISGDGNTIVGYAHDGRTHAFVITIPSPTAALGVLLFCLVPARRRKA